MKTFRPVSILLAMSLACGCASQVMVAGDRKPKADPSKAEEEAISAALQGIAAKKAEYKVSSADLLEITVYQEKDLSRAARVGQNGTISFPLIGAAKVGGLSVIEAEALLSDKLKDYLVSPQVSIFIKEYGNKNVYVLGEVRQPGAFGLPTESKLSVVEAISMAGGFTQIAAPDRTRLIRNIEGKNQTITIEVSAITKRGEKDKDLPLEPNDIVYVPQSFF